MSWQPIEMAKPDGTVCRLRFRDPLGSYESPPGKEYFLHEDGEWYQIDPPYQLTKRPTHWMPLPKPPAGGRA